MNYFEVFDLNVSFNIDKNSLKQTYNNLIKQNHPDNFTDNSENLKALEQTALINQAFKTLNDDLLRASYLLKLNNINAFDEKDTKMDTSFLIKQIGLQENLEDLADELALDEFLDNINNEIKLNIIQINENFQSNNLGIVRNLVRELKFYYGLKSLTTDKLDNFI